MNSRSSLLKRAMVPLLAVAAAAALCAPARAVTASWNLCSVVNSGTPYAGIGERVNCHFTANARWQEADFHTTLLGGNGTYNYEQDDTNFDAYCGVGDYTYPAGMYLVRPGANGTYNCWCVCRGLDYYGAAWNASTGGTTYVSWSGS